MSTALVVTSGGMDSTTAVYWAKERYDSIETISFDYGQRHKKELAFAKDTARRLDVPWLVVDLMSINELIRTSALTNPNIDVPEGHYADETMKLTVVPNRNSMMLNIAAARAVSMGHAAIITGVHAGDHAVYPDCRPEFIQQLEVLLHVANEGFIDPDFAVSAPFINLTKAQIAQEGDTLGVPWDQTWTCYKGDEYHCGRCSTCVERIEAFHIAGVDDPTFYMDDQYWKTVTNAVD